MIHLGARKRTVIAALVGGGLGFLLLILLFRRLPFDAPSYFALLESARWSGLAGILATTVLHYLISGFKWRYVTRLSGGGTELGMFYYFYSAVIDLMGQVLPLQVALLVGRSLALRVYGDVPVRRGASGVVFDQFFDMLVPATFLVPIMLAACSVISNETALGLSVVLLVGVGGTIVLLGEPALLAVLRSVMIVFPKLSKRGSLLDALQKGAPGMMKPRKVAILYILSCVRFFNVVLRAWLVAWTLHMDIAWIVVVFANCGVTFSQIFAFIPGALGVVEWGWVGMFHLFGVEAVDAAQYALSSRVFGVTAVMLINLVHGALLMAYWIFRRVGSSKAGAQ